ncbi:hypothetical protein B0182_13655, partial [Moraxella bovis]
ATTAEAVAMASMPTNAIINNSPVIQNVKTDVRIFGEQLFRGAFSTTSGSTFNDSYVINVGDNVQVRMWGQGGEKICLIVYFVFAIIT